MKLSTRAIEKLVDIITGNSQESPYRSGPQLIEFFYEFGERDLYGQGFPSRHAYVRDKLKKFNGADIMKKIVVTAFAYLEDEEFRAENAASQFNALIERDGFRLVLEYGPGWMSGAEFVRGAPYFEV